MRDELHRNGRLDRVAREVAGPFGDEPGVRAVLLCGSVARGWADRWSDVEVVVCWEAVPAPEARADLAARLGASGRRAYPVDDELGTHDEEFAHAGVKIDLAHVEASGIAAILHAVTVAGDPSPRKHAMVAGIRDAIALAGDDALDAWKRQAARYPGALQRAMIERNLVFGPHWWLEMLADRNDLLPLRDILVRIGRATLGIVAAVNRTYLPSDGSKWASRVAAQLPLAPERFAGRLDDLYRLPPGAAVREAQRLIDDVLDLVERYVPEVPMATARARVSTRRIAAP